VNEDALAHWGAVAPKENIYVYIYINIHLHKFDVYVTVFHILKLREVPTWCKNCDLFS